MELLVSRVEFIFILLRYFSNEYYNIKIIDTDRYIGVFR